MVSKADDELSHAAKRGNSAGPPQGDKEGTLPPHSIDDPQDGAHPTIYDPNTGSYREKQIKPNKIYIGNIPEKARQQDLEECFRELGNIVSIELKQGYGFVEFDTREAAERSVEKYNEGLFLGNRIRVQLSHGGGKTAKFAGDPGACFKCRQSGHWARECPNPPVDVNWRDFHKEGNFRRRHDLRRPHHAGGYEYGSPRSPPDFRSENYDDGRSRHKDLRYESRPPRDAREYRSPRDPFPPAPPRVHPRDAREFDDYRTSGGRAPSPPPAHSFEPRLPPPDERFYDSRPYESRQASYYGTEYDRHPPPTDSASGSYSSRSAHDSAPPHLSGYGYDRREAGYPPSPPGRRSPPFFDNRRDHVYNPQDYRGRPNASSAPNNRFEAPRRRSMSPPPRSGVTSYRNGFDHGPAPSSSYSRSGPPPRSEIATDPYYENTYHHSYAPSGRDMDRRFSSSGGRYNRI
ncbi:hypothetical protein FRC02_000015 [Tulasnella sp. 418]|nr:hypothetical protein FRC02_000015 [Tulasnella sp. 418]